MRPQPSASARLYDRSREHARVAQRGPAHGGPDHAADARIGEPPTRGASRAGDAAAWLRRARGRRLRFEPPTLDPAWRRRADVPRASPEARQRPWRGGARALDPPPAAGAAPGHRARPLAVRVR